MNLRVTTYFDDNCWGPVYIYLLCDFRLHNGHLKSNDILHCSQCDRWLVSDIRILELEALIKSYPMYIWVSAYISIVLILYSKHLQ